MEKKFSGRVWKFGDDVDTDCIIENKAGVLPTVKEMSAYTLRKLRPEFASEAKQGDFIVAGNNFGCGSSREMAAEVIKECGISCIIAKSFARIFFRNCINNGLLLIESPDVWEAAEDGQEITVEVNQCVTVYGQQYPIPNIPEHLLQILEAGGLINSNQKKNRALKNGGKI